MEGDCSLTWGSAETQPEAALKFRSCIWGGNPKKPWERSKEGRQEREGQKQSLYHWPNCHCGNWSLLPPKRLENWWGHAPQSYAQGQDCRMLIPQLLQPLVRGCLGVEVRIYLIACWSATCSGSPGSVSRARLQAKSYRYWELVTQGDTGRYPQHLLQLQNQFIPAFKKQL